jgi:putative ABC transport system permease protein
MQTFWQDIRYGIRGLVKNPAFTIIAVLSLGLGIGANTAIFSLINTVLLQPLPFHQPEKLAIIWEEASFAGFPQNTPAPANYADWKTQNQSFEDMAALANRSYNITGDGEPQRIEAYAVTANFFPLLGVQPILGRAFLADDDRPEANRTALLSYGLWQSRYGGQRDLINKDIHLDGEKYTVIGVMPAGFQFLSLEGENFLWVPTAFTPEQLANRGGHYLKVVGRLKPDVTLAQAQADIDTIMQRLRDAYPDQVGRLGATVLPLSEQLTGEVRRPFLVLLVAVGFVLLIACVNVANLLLSRATNRRKEIAVRSALGASRLRIIRQLLSESVLLGALGGVIGLLFALWSFSFLEQLVPADLILSAQLRLDLRVLGFALFLSLLTSVVFGLAPALQASKIDLNEALKQGGGRGGTDVAGNRLRGTMVIFEVALALVLLVGAGLLIQTFFHLRDQYSDLQPEKVLTIRTALPRTKYDTHQKRLTFYDQVLGRVTALPGVETAGYTTTIPLVWKGGTSGFTVEGQQVESSLSYDANHRQVTAGYLKAMGVGLKDGRYFEESDSENSLPVAMINETMARQYWQGEKVIGKRFKIGRQDSERPWLTVVGVVADVRQMGTDVAVKAEMYLPHRQTDYQTWFAPQDLVIRTTVDPMKLVAAVRREIHSVDADQPLSNIRTMSEVLGEETAQRRLRMILLVAFAALALLLSSIGIYGVLSYFVAQHTPEIGVRLALGARSVNILGLVLKRGMGLALSGVGIGLLSSFALVRLMETMLYGIQATDLMTFVVVAVVLTAVAFVACLVPARRATKVDPMVALRYE